MNDCYYTLINPRLLESKHTEKIIRSYFGRELSKNILAETHQEFLDLRSELPLLEGKKHLNSLPLVDAAFCLALYRILKIHSMTTEQIGKLYYELFEAFLGSKPKLFRFLYGKFKYGKGYINRYKKYAAETQKRKYPEDFVCIFIEGASKDFDYGYDYTECAILKYFQAHEANELAPFFCYIDFSLAKAFNRGLTRVKTLSEGDEKCEFRYKKGRTTKADWPPEFLKKELGS